MWTYAVTVVIANKQNTQAIQAGSGNDARRLIQLQNLRAVIWDVRAVKRRGWTGAATNGSGTRPRGLDLSLLTDDGLEISRVLAPAAGRFATTPHPNPNTKPSGEIPRFFRREFEMRYFRVEWVLLGVWHTTLVRAGSAERAAADVRAAHPGAVVGQVDEL